MKSRKAVALTSALLVLAMGIAMFATATIKRRRTPAKQFVATFTVKTARTANETPTLTEVQTIFFQDASNWKRERYFMGGESSVAILHDGVLLASPPNGRDLQFMNVLSNSADKDAFFRSVEFHRSHPEFVRTETVAGLTTYVHHAEGGGTIVEGYYAVETGLTPLKTVFTTPDGFQDITEVVSVQFRDILPSEVAVPNGPISFTNVEAKIAGLSYTESEKLSAEISEAKSRLKRVAQSLK